MREFLEDPTKGLVRSKRPAQVKMYESILQIGENGGIAAIQAGTGTGKSYAYLLALIDLIRQKKIGRAIVATAKKTLQSQLLRKDLPALAASVGKFPYASLKGKGNYACQLRYNEFLDQSPNRQYPDFDFDAFTRWLEQDPVGEFSSYGDIPFAWQVRVTECVKDHCPNLATCGYARNRFASKDAEILVVNHSLLALDLQLGRGKVLGEYDMLVVDEAHQLSDFATKAYAFELNHNQIEQLERGLQADGRIKVPENLISAYDSMFNLLTRMESGAFPLIPATERALSAVTSGLNELKSTLQKNGARVEMLVPEAVTSQPDLEASDVHTARRMGRLNSVGGIVAKLLRAIETIKAKRDDFVTLIERRDFRDTPRLTVTPLEVGAFLGPALTECGKVVLTSATLKTTDGIGFLCRGLGLTPKNITETLDLPSPFDYRNRTRMWVSPTAPSPTGAAKGDALRQQIEEMHSILTKSGGGAFILCASREDMRAISVELTRKGAGVYRVITQSDHIDRDLADFLDGYNNVLVGVKSIWEGVDVPGMKLRVVIIPRLPFPNPSDLLHTARKNLVKSRRIAAGEDAAKVGVQLFQDFDLQMVAIDIAQGSGRLVRTETDFGLLVFLDPRMHSGVKGYSNSLRNLLPHPPIYKIEELDHMIQILNRLAEKERLSKTGAP